MPRPAVDLISVADFASLGRVLLLPDTNVYIADVAGKLPLQVQSLLDRELVFHCSVCLSELATGVANAEPSAGGWPSIRDHYIEVFDNVQRRHSSLAYVSPAEYEQAE